MLKILHLSDIHLGSGLVHGQINPTTGLNTRLEDFIQTLGMCIDRAIDIPVDLVLFSGDAFPDAMPPPYIQAAFARQFRRLVDAKIPTLLLEGNHDQHSQGKGGSSLCIYRTLGVPGFIVGDRLETHLIQTYHGPIQVVTLPWLNHSTLLTRPEMERLSLSQINHHLLDRLKLALEAEIRQLDSSIPAILVAHAMVDGASYGAERFLAVGKGFTIPLSLVARDCFNYVALGHVHRHQTLCTQPPVVYAGSIERVDFSEESEEKGYVLIELEPGYAQFQFCPLSVRPFKTIKINVSNLENPEAEILSTIAQNPVENAIVRLIYQISPSQLSQINDVYIHEALQSAHTYTVYSELMRQGSVPRVPEFQGEQPINPLDALRTYLSNRQDLNKIALDLISAAEILMNETENERSRPLPIASIVQLKETTVNYQWNLPACQEMQLPLL